MNMQWEEFYCKHCGAGYYTGVPERFTGDAFVQCDCGWKHPRQFVEGVAVSCNLPRGSYLMLTRKPY